MLLKNLWITLSMGLVSLAPHAACSKSFCKVTWPKHNPGLFSIFNTVLGTLAHYELDGYTGVAVDFGMGGPYYDKEYGPNWWNYYFEPINVGSSANVSTCGPDYGGFCAYAQYQLTRNEKYLLIHKYIKPKAYIQKQVEQFVKEYFKDYYVIGIHYRGTDKWIEAPRVDYQTVYRQIMKLVKKRNIKHWRVFVATDEAKFLDYMSHTLPGRVYSIDTIRSTNGSPVHYGHSSSNYKKGLGAVVDCLLLAECALLIRTASNLSNASASFNPAIPIITLNKPNDGPQDIKKSGSLKIGYHALRHKHQHEKALRKHGL